MHPELDVSNEWFTNPTGFIEEAKKTLYRLSQSEIWLFSIEVTGQQLLEAMEDEKLSKQNKTENEFDKANRNINNLKKGGGIILGVSTILLYVKKHGKDALKFAKKWSSKRRILSFRSWFGQKQF